ncbi:head GIN domain-containing protein [Winogradskyella poriferorum]|uniref:head GIN domain-containing protein n=1 Tax=Winogradskyella poriferorum TaxID=307627 RepID=UPI003D65E63B
MKKFTLILAFIISLPVLAQQTIEKSLGEFSTVKVYDLINLNMIQSNENKVVISGRNKNDVEVLNKNGKLKIRMNIEEIYDGNDTVVSLYYTSVEEIDANEGSKVAVKETIEQFEIELRAQEGAEITTDLKTKYATVRAVTGGIINVSGSSKNQDLSIYTGGIVNAKEFITEKTEVSINAAGEAFINASEFVDVRIRAGGDVYIYGNPKRIDESRVFGGRIKRM